MPNEIKHIKSKPTNLTGPNAARQQVSLNREQDSKPSKKAGDGAMTFMVWSIAGTVIAACSSPIFSDVADLTGGGGGGDAQGGPGGVGALTNGRISGADISVVNENGVSGADVGHSDEAGNIILDDGADLEIGAQYDADLSVPGAREISTGEGVSGTLRSLPYSGGDLVISPLTDLLAKARNDATDQEVIDAGGADGFYQGVLDSIYGESIVTVADVLNRYHYNPLVTDDAVTQLVSQGATALSEIQEQDRTTPNADRIVTLQELFSGYRDNIADDDATNDAVVLSNSGTIDEGVEGRITAAVARGGLPVVATPNGGDAIQMTEDQDLPLVSGNAELLFGFQDPFGNSDSPDDEDDAREDGQLVGIYIQAASVDGNIDVMFRDNDRGIVGLASVQGADRGVVTSTPAPHNNTFFYVSAENFGQLILSPDANFNTENRPNPQIRFYVYDGEDVTPETGIGMLEIEVATENDAPEITSQTTPAPITSNAGSASGTFQVSDADGDTDFTWSATGPTTYGTLEFNNAMSGNGAWTFTLNAEAFDGIADGENVPVTFNITATDLSGGVSEPVSVVIMLQGQNVPTTGTNVAPTDIQATLDGASEAVADNALVATYDGNAPTADMVVATLMTSDDDTGDTHMYSITGADMNSFRINGNQLLFASGVTEADNRNPGSTWSVDITSRDSGGLDVTQTFTIERAGNAFPVFDTEASTDYDATNSRFTKDVTDDNMNPDPDMDSPTATGTIVATDADGGTVTLSARQSGGTEDLGNVGFNGNVWTFALLPAGVIALNALGGGATEILTFEITASDGSGTDTATLRIRLVGATDDSIDEPDIDTPNSGLVGTIMDDDASAHDNTPTPAAMGAITLTPGTDISGLMWSVASASVSGLPAGADANTDFGTLTLPGSAFTSFDAQFAGDAGTPRSLNWVFTPTDAINALRTTDTDVTITYVITASNNGGSDTGSIATLVINLDGVNDTPELARNVADGAVTEAGGTDNNTAGDAMANGSLTITDPDVGHEAFDFTGNTLEGRAGTSGAYETDGSIDGTYGTLTLNDSTGAWTYALRDDDPDTQALDAGDTEQDVFNIQLVNADGADIKRSDSVTLTIGVTGADDALVFGTNNFDPVVVTADNRMATGTFSASDPDADDDITWEATTTSGLGTVAFVNNVWTFTLTADGVTALEALAPNATTDITFDIAANGEDAGGDLTITLTGATAAVNAAPTLTPSAVVPDDGYYTVEMPGTDGGTSAGTLMVDDTDPADTRASLTVIGVINDGVEDTLVSIAPPMTTPANVQEITDAGQTFEGVYGNFVLTRDANSGVIGWDYQIDETLPATNALGGYDSTDSTTFGTETLSLRVWDDEDLRSTNIETISVQVRGADDAATITSPAGAFSPVTVMDPDRDVLTDNPAEPGRVYTGTFSATDPDSTISWLATATGDHSTLGTVVFDSTTDMNEWVFRLEPAGVTALNTLAAGATTDITFTISANGVDADTPLTIRLMGAADTTIPAPEIDDVSSEITGTVTDTDARDHENTPSSASGTIMASTTSPNNITWNSSNIAINGFTGRAASEFGSLALVPNANGTSVTWTFTPTDAINDLSDGDVGVTITYTIAATAGGHDATRTLTITLAGVTNDVPEIVTGSQFDPQMITDDMADVSTNEPAAISGAFTATGTVTGWTSAMASFTGDIPAGRTAADFGSFTLNDNGEWTFDPTTVINDLGMGQSVIFEYTITADNAAGSSTSETFRITLTGTNDVPTITTTGGGQSLTDASADDHIDDPSSEQTITGTAVASDVDADDGDGANGADDFTWSIDGGTATTTYGTLVFDNSGVGGGWTFMTDPAAFNELTHGQSMPITYSVQAEDPQNGTSAAMDLTFTLVGVNDKPDLAVTETDVNVIEAGGANNAVAGDTAANGSITITDPDTGHNVFTFAGNTLQGRAGTSGAFTNAGGAVIEGVYGDLTLMTDGTWAYELDNSDADTQGLRGALTNGDPAEMMTDVFNIRLENVDAGDTQTSDIETITITVTGADDATEITSLAGAFGPVDVMDPDRAVLTDNPTEPAAARVYTGTFSATDDDDSTITWSATATGDNSGLGTVTFDNPNDMNEWVFGLTPMGVEALNALDPGATTNITFNITATTDSGSITAPTPLTIRLMGAADNTIAAPEIDTNSVIIGTVTDTDARDHENTPSSASGTIMATTSSTNNITWNSSNMMIDGFTGRAASEFGDLTLTPNANGTSVTWEFTPTDAINDLSDGDVGVTITYTIAATAGGHDATTTLTINLAGVTNDVPEIVTGSQFDPQTIPDTDDVSTNEPAAISGAFTATGTVTGWSSTMASFTGDIPAGRTAAEFGAFTLNDNGEWTFDPTTVINDLGMGQSVAFEYTITADNLAGSSASQAFTITLEGTNDVPTITSTGGGQSLTDASATDHIIDPSGEQTITGTAVASDVDATDGANDLTWSIAGGGAATTTYGTLVFDNSGVGGGWTFMTDPAAFNELTHGQSMPITYSVQAEDPQNGTSAAMDLTFTLVGVNDKPDLAVTETDVNVIEAGGANNAMAGDTAANGSITITDPDTGHNVFTFAGNTLQGRAGTSGAFTNAGGAVIEGVYGDLTLMTDGTWAYELDNSDADTQGLRGALTNGDPAEMMTDVFNIRLENVDAGDTQTSDVVTLTINVTGANDDPVIVTDTGIFSTGITITDDNPIPTNDPDAVNQATVPMGGTAYGSFTATDVDTGDTITWSPAMAAQPGAPATGSIDVSNAATLTNSAARTAAQFGALTVNADGTWSFDPTTAINDIANNEHVVLSYDIVATDSSGGTDMETLTVRLNGVTNVRPPADAPVFLGSSESTHTFTDGNAAPDNDFAVSATRSILVSNPDDLTWSVAEAVVDGDTTETDAAHFGAITFPSSSFVSFGAAFPGNSLGWAFDPNTRINDLNSGQSVTITYAVTATNRGGASSNIDLVITLEGLTNVIPNSAPTLTPPAGGHFVVEDSSTSMVNGTLMVDDPDLTDTVGSLTVIGVINDQANTLNTQPDAGMISSNDDIYAITGALNQRLAGLYGDFVLTRNGNGAIDWRYEIDEARANSLDETETPTETLSLRVWDDEGLASSTETISVEVRGADDALVFDANNDFGPVVVLDPSTNAGDTPTETGTFSATDHDDEIVWEATTTDTTLGAVEFSSTTNGMWTFTLMPAGVTALNDLASGSTQDIIFDITANGMDAGSDLTIRLTGAAMEVTGLFAVPAATADTTGTSGVDMLDGTAAAETIQGGNDSDTITTGGGNDLVIGGHGIDTINLDSGAETIVYRFESDARTGDNAWQATDGGDIINNFRYGQDKLIFVDISDDTPITSLEEFIGDSDLPTFSTANINTLTGDIGGIQIFFPLAGTLDGASGGTESGSAVVVNFDEGAGALFPSLADPVIGAAFAPNLTNLSILNVLFGGSDTFDAFDVVDASMLPAELAIL